MTRRLHRLRRRLCTIAGFAIALAGVAGFGPGAFGRVHRGQEGALMRSPTPDTVLRSLTDEERSWLQNHPVIRVAQDPGWPPIEFLDDRGEPSGITVDYLALIERRLGVTFERVPTQSWQDSYARLKRWDIDMTTSVAVTPEREQFWIFTRPYMHIPVAILTHSDVTYVPGMQELVGKKIAAVDNYAVTEWVARDYPGIELVKVQSVKEGLDRLEQGDVFGLIDNMLVLGYFMAKLELVNLKIAGDTPYENAQCMAVRKDWPVFARVLQKALDSITETERADIYGKWVPIRYEHGFNYGALWETLALFTAIVVGLIIWNHKLMREIQHRREAEAALRKNEALLSQTQEVTRVGGWEYDVATNRVSWTDEMYRLHEVSREYDPGDASKNIEFFETDARVRLAAAFRGAVEHGEPYDLELPLVTAEGRALWVRSVGRAERRDDRVARVFGYFLDITDRRRAEEQARSAAAEARRLLEEADRSARALLSVVEDQKLAEEEIRKLNEQLEERVRERTAQLLAANKELEAFAYSVSHDLRGPLRTIAGFSQMLTQDLSSRLSEQEKQDLGRITGAAFKMSQMIDDMLSLSRLTRQAMKIGRVDLSRIANELSSDLLATAPARKAEFVIAPEVAVDGDEGLLRQVMQNLLENSWKFTRNCEKARIEFGAVEKDGHRVFFIRDNGAGFDMKYKDKLFGAFQRIHKESEFEGTGIGLATVRRILQRHGGTIWGEGAVGKGATFYFTL